MQTRREDPPQQAAKSRFLKLNIILLTYYMHNLACEQKEPGVPLLTAVQLEWLWASLSPLPLRNKPTTLWGP